MTGRTGGSLKPAPRRSPTALPWSATYSAWSVSASKRTCSPDRAQCGSATTSTSGSKAPRDIGNHRPRNCCFLLAGKWTPTLFFFQPKSFGGEPLATETNNCAPFQRRCKRTATSGPHHSLKKVSCAAQWRVNVLISSVLYLLGCGLVGGVFHVFCCLIFNSVCLRRGGAARQCF